MRIQHDLGISLQHPADGVGVHQRVLTELVDHQGVVSTRSTGYRVGVGRNVCHNRVMKHV